MKLNTALLLIAEFESATVELRAVCDKYFGMDYKQAARRASLNNLPIPAFRCGTQKAAWMIHVEDLAKHIDKQRHAAETAWQKMNEI